MTFDPVELHSPRVLEFRVAAVETKLLEASARVQALFREGKHDEMRLAQADVHFLKVDLRTLRRMMLDSRFGSP